MKNKENPPITVAGLAAKEIQNFFPLKIAPHLICEAVSKEECKAFVTKNFSKVFSKDGELYYVMKPKSSAARKLRPLWTEYEKIHHEYFLFKFKGKPVGWVFGEMDDFETFYLRNLGLLPSQRRKGAYSAFLVQFLKYAEKLGYQRVSAQHNPGNRAILNIHLGLGFIIVGTENHERWGQLLKTVKILDQKRELQFKKKFT